MLVRRFKNWRLSNPIHGFKLCSGPEHSATNKVGRGGDCRKKYKFETVFADYFFLAIRTGKTQACNSAWILKTLLIFIEYKIQFNMFHS